MRVPRRWVVSLGLTLYATGCLPAISQPPSLVPSTQANLPTVASERSGSGPTDAARAPATPAEGSSKKKWILIGAAAAALIVVIILISGGSSDYSPPEGRVAPIR